MRSLSMACALPALVLVNAATPALAEQTAGWDRNADSLLDRQEFDRGAADAGIYRRMDARADGVLDSDEFYGGIFDLWDDDDDLGVSEAEFGRDGTRWFGEAEEHGDFDAWDANADGVIGEDEFGAGAGASGLYETWGGEDGIAEDEFHSGLFDAADRNADGALGRDEDGLPGRF